MTFFKKFFPKKEKKEEVGFEASTCKRDGGEVVLRTTVPHHNGEYGVKWEIFLLKTPSGEKTEKEAYLEYVLLKEKFSGKTGFQIKFNDQEALEFFADREILSVKNSAAGINPVQCAGNGIFSLEGGVLLEGYSGSGQRGIEEAFQKNNAAVGKTVGEVFLGLKMKLEKEDNSPEIVSRRIYGGPGMSHKYADVLFYNIGGNKTLCLYKGRWGCFLWDVYIIQKRT